MGWFTRLTKRSRRLSKSDPLASDQLGFDPEQFAGIASVRLATLDDLPAVQALQPDQFRVNWPQGNWRVVRRATNLRLRKAIAKQPEGDDRILVALSADRRFIGYVWWSYRRGADGNAEALVDGIGVRPEYRGKGASKVLGQCFIQWVVGDGLVDRIVAGVSPANEPVMRLLGAFAFEKKFEVWHRAIER